MGLTLYIGGTCPFCLKVTDFCKANAINLNTIDVWKSDADFEYLQQHGGKTQVPCLKIDDKFMYESDDIIAFLKDQYNV